MLPYWLSKTRMENLLPNEGYAKTVSNQHEHFLVLVMLLLSLRLALFLTISAMMLLQFCLRLPNNLCFLLVQIHCWAVTSKLFSVNHFPSTWQVINTKKLGKHGGKSYAIEQNPHEIQKIVAGCVFLMDVLSLENSFRLQFVGVFRSVKICVLCSHFLGFSLGKDPIKMMRKEHFWLIKLHLCAFDESHSWPTSSIHNSITHN